MFDPGQTTPIKPSVKWFVIPMTDKVCCRAMVEIHPDRPFSEDLIVRSTTEVTPEMKKRLFDQAWAKLRAYTEERSSF